MVIFISHSSKNANYGNALVDLLIGVGVGSEQIIFTSNNAYGIPVGKNIFDWLKNKIKEKPHVIYLLSKEYYSSIACLNEMGAAWIVENEHTMIFMPNFNLSSYEFQNGALDPREIGFFINNGERLLSFIESLRISFSISQNPILVNQKIQEFLNKINPFQKIDSPPIADDKETTVISGLIETEKSNSEKKMEINKDENKTDNALRFFSDLMIDKLRDEEVLLISYVMDKAKFKLGTGWQESHEIENIKMWEEVNGLNSKLSVNYTSVLRRLEAKKLTEISNLTSQGNPKEIKLIEKLQGEILELSEEIQLKIIEVVKRNKTDDLPF